MIAWSAHLSTLFAEVDPLQRPAAAAAAGFTAVETWWPPAAPADEWAAAERDAGLVAVLVNADGGDLAAGERGFCNHAERADEVVAAVEASVRVGLATGGPGRVNLLVGRDDGVRPREEQVAVAVATVRRAGDAAAALGGSVVIEHLNAHDVDGPLVSTPSEALMFVEAVGHPAVGILFDAYHAVRMDLDARAEFTRVVHRVGHVQYADSPGRGAPGTGTIDLAEFVADLSMEGYRGHVGLEFVPVGSTADALAGLPALGG
ncbi:MAG: TIM barrel protein [Miltoncostaeaceae bacterium]